MKIRLKHFSKSTLSVVLTLCLVFSCATVGLVATDAAQVDGDSVGSTLENIEWLKFHSAFTGYDFNGNGISQWSDFSMTKDSGDSNHFYNSFYTASSQSETQFGWNIKFNNNGTTYWKTMNGEHFTAQETSDKTKDCSSATNDKISTISASSGWVHVYLDFWGKWDSDTRVKVYQLAVSQISSSVSVGSSTLTSGQTTSITATSSGGTGTPSNSIKIRRGSASGTDVTSSVLSGTTFTAPTVSSTTTYYVTNTATDPVISSYSVTSSASTITVNPAETTYSVSVSVTPASSGTLSNSSAVTAGANTKGYLPTVTPNYPYKFKRWSTSSAGVTISNPTSNDGTAYVNATAAGSVTAELEVDMSKNIYIVGRFRYRKTPSSGWTTTYGTGVNWDADSTNIKMSATSTDFVYKLDTNASLSELSANIGNDSTYTPYFHIKDGSNVFCPSSNTAMTTSGTTLGTTGSNNMYFESSSDETPVTIYFNTSTKKIWYTVPEYYTITCSEATGGSVTSNGITIGDDVKQKQGETVTLTLTPEDGYRAGTVTVTKAGGGTVTVSGSGNTRTFTMPDKNVTVTATFTEITHTVNVKRRYYQSNGTTLISTDSNNYQTLTGVGITTTGTAGPAPTVADYTFWRYTRPSGVTLSSGSLTTAAAIDVNATVDNATIYIDYKETLHTITLENSPAAGGSIKESGTSNAIRTISVGNVTGVTLVATPNSGYQFDSWSSSSNAVTIGNTANYSTTFKTSADATVTANYTAVDYTISASANPTGGATVTTTDTSGNSKTGGHIGEQFEIRIVVNSAAGYELETNPISFATGTGYETPTLVSGYPQTSNGTVIYRYTLGAGDAVATVRFKAKTPTISNVFIKDTSFEYTEADDDEHNTVDNFFRQPLEAKAATDNFSTLSYTITYSDSTTTTLSQLNGVDIVSDDEVSIPTNLDKTCPDSENGTKTYTLRITATNAPSGVTAATTYQTFTINVSFNDTQKIYYKTKEFLVRCIREATSDNPYYKPEAPIAAYNTAYDAAKHFIDPDYNYPTTTYDPQNTDYPAYNASSDDYDAANTIWNDFKNAYDALRLKANTTTIYVLTKYQNSASNPILLHTWQNSNNTTITPEDRQHFEMYSYFSDSRVLNNTDNTYKMDYVGKLQKNGSDLFLYSFTYTGHINFIVWRGSSAIDSMADGKKLTLDVTNLRDFKEYYINVYNTTEGSTSFTQSGVVDYADFDHTWVNKTSGAKVTIGFEESQTKEDLISKFSVSPTGSPVTAPGIFTENYAFTITGPIGKSNSTTYDLLNTSAENYVSSFPADKPGRYTINYTTRFGFDTHNDFILRTAQMTLWVNSDDINVYVDMNDNVGIPILNIPYQIDANNEPVASGGTLAYLPYEMDLVTGSESIYKYTIKISKLKSDYKLDFSANTPIPISYITVESRTIYNTAVSQNQNAPFEIGIEAKTTGEIWFKADSTKLKTFTTISYGSATKSFVAITEDGNKTVLPSAITFMRGTGINTDDDEIYHNTYASLYMLDQTDDDADNPQLISKFHYVLNTSVAQEVEFGGNKYYFDKWQKFVTTGEGLKIEDGCLTADITAAVDFTGSSSPSLNFTTAPDESGNYSYIALYKQVSNNDTTVRVEVTYKFQDYDTSDGNYIYDENKDTVDASYTKVIKVKVGSGQLYVDFAAVKAAVNTIAQSNVPYIKSNYFDYDYDTQHAAAIPENGANTNESKISVDAYLKETARTYSIVVKNGNTNYLTIDGTNDGDPIKGNYQQTVTLDASNFGGSNFSNPVWKDRNGNILAVGNTYKARYVASGFERNDGDDCQIITLMNQSGASVTNKSVVSDSFTEVYYTGSGTEMLRHNFYIIDYCLEEGKLVGGGVLFATTDRYGNYRQTNAATQLINDTSRKNYISGILNNDYTTEYKAQTINNVGFRYKPFKSTEDVYHYSDDLQAYLTMFEGTNVNSESYDGQKLRLFSFMVYDNNGTNTIVVSDGYAEVDRYQPQTQS